MLINIRNYYSLYFLLFHDAVVKNQFIRNDFITAYVFFNLNCNQNATVFMQNTKINIRISVFKLTTTLGAIYILLTFFYLDVFCTENK